jgi:hypothetical protein
MTDQRVLPLTADATIRATLSSPSLDLLRDAVRDVAHVAAHTRLGSSMDMVATADPLPIGLEISRPSRMTAADAAERAVSAHYLRIGSEGQALAPGTA